MTFRKNALRVGVAATIGLMLVMPFAGFAVAATTTYAFSTGKDVIITEVQTASLGSSGEEFVELFNTTGTDIDLADTAHGGKNAWKLQYFSKTKLGTLLPAAGIAGGWTSPFRTISLTGVIPAGDYYVLAGEGYAPGNLDPDQTYTSTLADDGGALQLVDATTNGATTTYGVHDRLAWSSDKTLAANPLLYTAPGAGASLQRSPNADNEYLNQDGTVTSFVASPIVSPKNVWQPLVVEEPPVVEEEPATTTTDTPADTSAAPEAPAAPEGNQGLRPVVITELLINPASPQTDEVDEYIELYNPNETVFNLNGYTLETGTTTLHDFTFTSDVVVQPGEYRAFYSFETKLALSNSGGQVKLLDKTQVVIAQSDPYTTASDGMSWSLDVVDGTWKWTSSLTPGAANLIMVPAVVQKATKTTKAKAVVAKKTTAKVKGASTTKASKAKKAAKAKKVKVATAAAASSSPVRPSAPIHVSAIAAVAALGVAYMLYEYRHDLGNRLHQFRTNRAIRAKAGK